MCKYIFISPYFFALIVIFCACNRMHLRNKTKKNIITWTNLRLRPPTSWWVFIAKFLMHHKQIFRSISTQYLLFSVISSNIIWFHMIFPQASHHFFGYTFLQFMIFFGFRLLLFCRIYQWRSLVLLISSIQAINWSNHYRHHRHTYIHTYSINSCHFTLNISPLLNFCLKTIPSRNIFNENLCDWVVVYRIIKIWFSP